MKFTAEQLTFIKAKFNSLTSREMFDHLLVNFSFDKCYTSFRTECYANGFYKCEMRRWSAEEKKFLLDNYQTMGNVAIAEKLTKKGRIFTKKQVQKQVRLLKLKRSPENLQFILDQNKLSGIYSKANYKRWERMKNPASIINEIAVEDPAKEILITVIINDKIRLKVKPGTDVEKLKSEYISAIENNWEAGLQ
ncbi:hypothetical protein SAMN05421847_2162 [Halpernia humi]|uniref:Uncharacterized protein n=1 Tax=Halpernia humi TaxID=493375 RepID=A0A1H5ZQX6_9FLAO|nr:hypothetical protein [Halpernia humi]SEG38898.1 hypothetical protein SAMN05421847_2162 [Halpernia humi]